MRYGSRQEGNTDKEEEQKNINGIPGRKYKRKYSVNQRYPTADKLKGEHNPFSFFRLLVTNAPRA